jgi:hypothetical protein
MSAKSNIHSAKSGDIGIEGGLRCTRFQVEIRERDWESEFARGAGQAKPTAFEIGAPR